MPLPVAAAETLGHADQRGIPFVLVHHAPKDGKNGTCARPDHRVEEPQVIELARRLGANQKMLVTGVAFAFSEGTPRLRNLSLTSARLRCCWTPSTRCWALCCPHIESRGRMELTLSFGCNGGRQRSAALALELARRLRARGELDVGVQLRDLEQRETP